MNYNCEKTKGKHNENNRGQLTEKDRKKGKEGEDEIK